MNPSRFRSLSPKKRNQLAAWDSKKSRQSLIARWS